MWRPENYSLLLMKSELWRTLLPQISKSRQRIVTYLYFRRTLYWYKIPNSIGMFIIWGQSPSPDSRYRNGNTCWRIIYVCGHVWESKKHTTVACIPKIPVYCYKYCWRQRMIEFGWTHLIHGDLLYKVRYRSYNIVHRQNENIEHLLISNKYKFGKHETNHRSSNNTNVSC